MKNLLKKSINFFYSKYSEETRTTHSKNDNIEAVKQVKSLKNFLILFYKNTKKKQKIEE